MTFDGHNQHVPCLTFQELGQEAVSGVDLLCRTSAEFLRELAETDIGGGGGRVLASFVRGVYRAPGGRWVPTVGFAWSLPLALARLTCMQGFSRLWKLLPASSCEAVIPSLSGHRGQTQTGCSKILDCCALFRPCLTPACAVAPFP